MFVCRLSASTFTLDNYDIAFHNCNSFSAELLKFLCEKQLGEFGSTVSGDGPWRASFGLNQYAGFFQKPGAFIPPCVCAIPITCARSGAQQGQRGPAPTSSGNFCRMCSSSQTWPGPSEMVDVLRSQALSSFFLVGFGCIGKTAKGGYGNGRPSIIKFARSAHELAGVQEGALYITSELLQERGRVSRTGRAGKVFVKCGRHNRLRRAQLSSPEKKRSSFPSRTLAPAAVWPATSDRQQTCFGLSLHNV